MRVSAGGINTYCARAVLRLDGAAELAAAANHTGIQDLVLRAERSIRWKHTLEVEGIHQRERGRIE